MPGISLLERQRIITLCEQGVTQRDIAKLMRCSYSAVNRILQAYRYAGRIENLPRGHRPRATTLEEDSQIVAASRRDPTLTAKEIRDKLNWTASPYVVRRRLHEGGLHSRVPVRKPLLSAINKSKRLAFAEEHVSWTVDDWRMVLFSDESTFTTRWDQRQRIWRPDCMR